MWPYFSCMSKGCNCGHDQGCHAKLNAPTCLLGAMQLTLDKWQAAVQGAHAAFSGGGGDGARCAGLANIMRLWERGPVLHPDQMEETAALRHRRKCARPQLSHCSAAAAVRVVAPAFEQTSQCSCCSSQCTGGACCLVHVLPPLLCMRPLSTEAHRHAHSVAAVSIDNWQV